MAALIISVSLNFFQLVLESEIHPLFLGILSAFYLAVFIWVRCVVLQGTEQEIVNKWFQEALWRTQILEPRS